MAEKTAADKIAAEKAEAEKTAEKKAAAAEKASAERAAAEKANARKDGQDKEAKRSVKGEDTAKNVVAQKAVSEKESARMRSRENAAKISEDGGSANTIDTLTGKKGRISSQTLTDVEDESSEDLITLKEEGPTKLVGGPAKKSSKEEHRKISSARCFSCQLKIKNQTPRYGSNHLNWSFFHIMCSK